MESKVSAEKNHIAPRPIPTQVWSVSHDGSYVSSNGVHLDFLSLDVDSVVGQSVETVLGPEALSHHVQAVRRLSESRQSDTSEEWYVDGRRERRLLRIARTPHFGDKGIIQSIEHTARDITDEATLMVDNAIKAKMLGAIVDFSNELFSDVPGAIQKAVTVLGRAVEVDRAYYWENHFDKELNCWLTNQRFEWCADLTEPQIDNEELQNIPLNEIGDFVAPLSQGLPYKTHIKDIPDGYTKDLLAMQDIQSILVLPLYLEGTFFGFVGFDSCVKEREWSDIELSLLDTFVHILSKSFYKRTLEDEIFQSRQNFVNFFNTINQMLFILDLQGNMLEVNDQVLERTGYEREELVGQPVLIMHAEHRRDEALQNVIGMLSGTHDVCPIPIITKAGDQIPVKTRVCEGTWNGAPVLFGASEDVSEIEAAEEKFSKAFESNALLMLLMDAEATTIIDVNAAACEFLGLSKPDVIGKGPFDLNLTFGEESAAIVVEAFQSKLTLHNEELEIADSSGNVHFFTVNTQQIYLGTKHCFVVSLLDTTERKAMEHQIEQYSTHLESMVEEKAAELSESQLATIHALVTLAESRDTNTGNHLVRLDESCRIVASQLGRNEKYEHVKEESFICALEKASYLHDIGKVAISDSILLKPGALTDAEFEEVKKHTTIGAQTLKQVDASYSGNPMIKMAIEIAQSHHERWDGSGYPEAICSDNIPISAQIVSICDVYDALRSRRVYKEPYPHTASLEIIREQSGKQFNPMLVEAFVESAETIKLLYKKLLKV